MNGRGSIYPPDIACKISRKEREERKGGEGEERNSLVRRHFYSRLLPTYGWQKDGGSMPFTELGLFTRRILDNYNVVRYHLLHISFFLTKEGF